MFIYFLADSNGRTKISVSGDPRRRANETGFLLTHVFTVASREIADLYKRRLHYCLWSVKDNADWFSVRPLDALRVLHDLRDQDPFNRLPIKRTWANPEYLAQALHR